jgi:hypothetical protein
VGDHETRQQGMAALDVPQLVNSLLKVASTVDQARALGLPVAVPESLYRACLEIVSLHDHVDGADSDLVPRKGRAQQVPGGRRSASGKASASGVTGDARLRVRDVPLRRLVLQVVNPGEEFTVSEVAERIAALGATWSASAVSNALGYWASRDRLRREQKGIYSYPPPSSVAAANEGERARQQEGPAADSNRPSTGRSKEDTDVSIPFETGKAAS